MNEKISAYVPCYNNQQTILQAIESLEQQSYPIEEIQVIDDGSSDHSLEIVQKTSAKIVKLEKNQGRGMVRCTAMQKAKNELVLCCDANAILEKDFVKNALSWFKDPNIAAVYGIISASLVCKNTAQRWRDRHLFLIDAENPPSLQRKAAFITKGAIVRKSIVLDIGNYNKNLTHSEDRNLGERLLEKGYDIVKDPSLKIISSSHDTLCKVLERYWRYYAGEDEAISWKGYLKSIVYFFKVRMAKDIEHRDLLAIPITLFCPHYQFWKSWWRSR